MITARIRDIDLIFHTSEAVFSPRRIDKGTLEMLRLARFEGSDKLLDLGCGYGVAGILAAKLIGPEKVYMCDVDEESVALARQNAVENGVPDVKILLSDGFTDIDDTDFTLIMSNPPYHTDFSVPKRFIEKGFNRLALGGRMMMVTKRKEWYKNKFISVFGGVWIEEVNGYFVFTAEKRAAHYSNKG